jgi:hypothetical protein
VDSSSVADALRGAGAGDLEPALFAQLENLLYGELELRVGEALSQRCTAQQLDEFSALADANDEEGMRQFLDRNLPEHPDVVSKELSALADETVYRLRSEGMLTKDVSHESGDIADHRRAGANPVQRAT